MFCCTSKCDIKRQDEKNQVLYQRGQEQPGKILAFSPGRGGWMGWASLTTMCVENLKAFICVCTCVLVRVYSCVQVRGHVGYLPQSSYFWRRVLSLILASHGLWRACLCFHSAGLEEQAQVLRTAWQAPYWLSQLPSPQPKFSVLADRARLLQARYGVFVALSTHPERFCSPNSRRDLTFFWLTTYSFLVGKYAGIWEWSGKVQMFYMAKEWPTSFC